MHPLGLTAVVPCYDEADSVAQTHAEIVAALGDYDLEILFVDDGSADGTLAEIQRLAAEDPRVQYLSFSRNFGFEAAFSAGYKYARKPWLVHLDADLQFPPAEVHHLVARALEGYDAVFGVRRTRHDPWHRRWGAACYHWLGRRLRIRIPPGATTFRVLRTELARRVVELRLGTPYFLATVPLLTSRIATVPVEHRPRTRGTSKFRLGRLIGHALELYVAFSRRAVHWVAIVLLLAALVSTGLAVAAFAGLLGAGVAVGAGLVAQSFALGGAAVLLRYTVLIADAQPRPAMFYVREASIPVEPADELFPGARPAPFIPAQRGDAA
ncbi:glycosyltransferase family 2 protein [Dactylosporangium sp. NPDC050688]|uniref:glycosyltransferase family 2 protein n=1 Tax=Dactylosporangium sp. NPDC050688 TaxID=3157217 RepID=UPI0033EDB1D1